MVEILELLLGEILPREEIFEGGGLPDHWKKSHLKGEVFRVRGYLGA